MAPPDIESILNDTTSGSEQLLSAYVEFFAEMEARSLPLSQLVSIAGRALHRHCHFVVVAHFLNQLINSATEPRCLHQTISQWAHRCRNMGEILLRLYISVKEPPSHLRVLTISQSGSVQALARALSASGTHLEVYQMRSEPGGEGALQWKALQQNGIPTHLIEDIQARHALHYCHEVWLGADLYTTKRFLNKVGSRQLTALAIEQGKKVFVVADRAKSLHYSSLPVWVLRCIAKTLHQGKAPLEWTSITEGVYILGCARQ